MTNQDLKTAQVVLGSDLTETFTIDGEKGGTFTVKMPAAGDWLKIGVVQHRLRGGVPLSELDDLSASLAIMLATLTVVVTDAPAWWYRTEGEGKFATQVPAPEQVQDLDLLWEIYGRYANWRSTFPDPERDSGNRSAATGADAVVDQPDTPPQPVLSGNPQHD